MAVTYPRTLFAGDVKSRAETKSFEALRDQLSDEWEVFHSAGMIIRDGAEGARDDECDFVLCHPEQGIISLEVKGGGIESRFGEWFRTDSDGKKERSPDPFQQASDHTWSLRRKIDEVDGWRGKDLFLVHALWFPDITAHKLVLAPDAPPEIILDRHDLKDVPTAIERVLAYHRGAKEKRKVPGEAGAEMLRDLLAPQVRIDVPMATAFADEEDELIELTREQRPSSNGSDGCPGWRSSGAPAPARR